MQKPSSFVPRGTIRNKFVSSKKSGVFSAVTPLGPDKNAIQGILVKIGCFFGHFFKMAFKNRINPQSSKAARINGSMKKQKWAAMNLNIKIHRINNDDEKKSACIVFLSTPSSSSAVIFFSS